MLSILLPALVLSKPFDPTGAWVPAPTAGRIDPQEKSIRLVFKKDGTLDVRSSSVKGKGTYKIEGNSIRVVLSDRNGSKPTNPREREALLKIVDGGKALLVPTGRSSGKLRMIRQK